MSTIPTLDGIPPPVMAQPKATESLKQASSKRKGSTDEIKKRERPCDACRRKKSRCVMIESQAMCASCAMHGQMCTFLEDPLPRKRRVEPEGGQPDGVKKRAQPGSKRSATDGSVKLEGSSHASPPPVTSNWHSNGYHVGYTTELEPMFFDISRLTGTPMWGANYQKSDARNAFLTFNSAEAEAPQNAACQAVETMIGENGPALIQYYETEVSRSFPIIESTALVADRRLQLDPALLCAIYTVSASSPGFSADENAPAPDIQRLADSALNLVTEALRKPTLSTIQAGLLLMQRSDLDTKLLNTQLVSAAFELGLHLDCTPWRLSAGERGLRKRLAWAVYMQDQWSSLTNGRPSLISRPNWAVQDLYDEDFETEDTSGEGDDHNDDEEEREANVEERRRGVECFCEMVALTEVLSSILDTFYTQLAIHEYDAARENGTRLILDRAKPIQINLKDWFTRLPKTLKLDHGQAPSLIGHLHLAYFATEITLHRCIIRSLANAASDTYLIYICRGAAKSRLISAMDFVNRLRSDHLQSFWYFPSKVNFALVATFGSLLLATAPTQEEAEFYRARLREYRWTLSVSAKNAGFLNFAIDALESSADLLKALPSKPRLEDLDLQSMPPPPLPIPHLIGSSNHVEDESQADGNEYADDNDNTMMDVSTLPEPIHSSAFQSSAFASGFGNSAEHADDTATVDNDRAFAGNEDTWSSIIDDSDAVGLDHQLADGITPTTGHFPAFTFHQDLLNTNASAYAGQARRPFTSGPFAGTPFEGLSARNWFDNSHHGSPEAESMGLLS